MLHRQQFILLLISLIYNLSSFSIFTIIYFQFLLYLKGIFAIILWLTAFLRTPGELRIRLDGGDGREAAARGGVGGGARPELGAELEAGVDGRVREQVEPLGHARAGAGGGVEAVAQRLHLLLGAAASLLELGRLHGGGAPARALARLGVRVDHPPRRLARALVLHAHEPVVQR